MCIPSENLWSPSCSLFPLHTLSLSQKVLKVASDLLESICHQDPADFLSSLQEEMNSRATDSCCYRLNSELIADHADCMSRGGTPKIRASHFSFTNVGWPPVHRAGNKTWIALKHLGCIGSVRCYIMPRSCFNWFDSIRSHGASGIFPFLANISSLLRNNLFPVIAYDHERICLTNHSVMSSVICFYVRWMFMIKKETITVYLPW